MWLCVSIFFHYTQWEKNGKKASVLHFKDDFLSFVLSLTLAEKWQICGLLQLTDYNSSRSKLPVGATIYYGKGFPFWALFSPWKNFGPGNFIVFYQLISWLPIKSSFGVILKSCIRTTRDFPNALVHHNSDAQNVSCPNQRLKDKDRLKRNSFQLQKKKKKSLLFSR